MSGKNFEGLRDYQLELFHKITNRKNCILFLPAGSGKTRIAFTVIDSMVEDLKRPIGKNGKRTFFLVNTVHLVRQQGAVLSTLGNIRVLSLTGDSRKNSWSTLLCSFEVFVVTSQIFLNALTHGYFALENVNLLIFDECHHATGDHPMAQIMTRVRNNPPETRPKILGLTATLFKANVKNTKTDFQQKLKELQQVFEGEIITSGMNQQIRNRYSAKPTDIIENVKRYSVPKCTVEKLTKVSDESMKILQTVNIGKFPPIPVDLDENNHMIQLDKPDANRLNQFKNMFSDILFHMDEYGLFMGYTCCQFYIVQLGRYMQALRDSRLSCLLLYTMNQTRLMREILYDNICMEKLDKNSNNVKLIQLILKTSSDKIRCLFNRIRNIKPSDRCIIFVKKKMTAKSLFKILKIFSESLDNAFTVDFTTGANSKNPLRKTSHDSLTKKEVLRKFSDGQLNVLVATNVLEEGIDVQECNIVVMFDGVKSFPSYIQSRGRARMLGSEYIILDHDTIADSQIEFFREVDSKLDEMFNEKNEPVSFVPEDSPDVLGNNTYSTSKGATVDCVAALQIVNLCCTTFAADNISKNSMPQWYYDCNKRICSVKLPPSFGVRPMIQGPPRSNRKEAKQAAALEVVILLHKAKILDDFLNPVTMKNSCSPLDADEVVSVNSPKIVHSPIRVPVFLKNSRPVQMLQCHLHVMKFTSSDQDLSAVRHRFCNELMKSTEYNFGILTRQKWPEICGFPVYSDLGEIQVELEVNHKVFMFPESRLKEISHFHRNLFVNVMKATRKCFSFDENRNCDNGYYIVPLRRNENNMYEILWSCINLEFPNEISKPTDEDIDKQEYSARHYVGKVVTQWYKPGVPHIVFDVSDKLFLKSRFLSQTYEEYFREKHGVVSRRPNNQPLLLVRPITTLNDSIRPKHGPGMEKKRVSDKGNEIHLAPEFCCVYPFPGVFWYKSTILPSTIHRIQHLLLAEDLRQRIVTEAKLGLLEVPKEEISSGSEVFREQKRCKKFLFQSENIVTPVKVRKSRVSERLHKLLHPKRIEESDYETEKWQYDGREHDATVDTVVEKFDELRCSSPSTTLLVDVLNDLTKIKSIDYNDLALVALLKMKNAADDGRSAPFFMSDKKIPTNGIQVPTINFVSTPVLATLKNHDGECGPKSHEILEAITLQDAQDVLHLERLETLGDSCLKYLVSFYLYTNGESMDEGDLTIMKSELVSNKNLFNCGEKLEIGSYIKVTNFLTKVFWCPPGFSLPSCFLQNQPDKDAHVNEFSYLLSVDIPQSEQVTGKISETTKNQEMKNTNVDGINAIREIDFLLRRQKLTPKSISDVLEALLGVYSVKTGIKNAFKLLHYFGILKDVGNEVPRGIADHDSSLVYKFLPKSACDTIERLTKYEFKNKAHLLQALTHASFTDNCLTDSYEKFEFLGDAILDFLVTSFLYEYHQHLDPGQLTDLRSALVNNITFGSLSMRLGLHQFFLCRSESLLEAIRTFAAHQKKRNHTIVLNEFMTVKSEKNNVIAEEVDVPKALGDIFESIAAAIYIDSGFDLEVVWRIYFNFMRNEIEKFCKKIPINPVRELYEKHFDLTFSTVEDNRNAKTIVSLLVVTQAKKKYSFMGRGDSMRAAKRAVARFALKNLNNDAFLVT